MSENSEPKYYGARFYKCALQVNPFSYGKRHDKDTGASSEDEYNRKMLNACKSAGVEVVALADHGNIDRSVSLWQMLRENGIVVFPGFEIASTEKIHMVCFFPEKSEIGDLDRYLGAMSASHAKKIGEKNTHASALTCVEIAQQVAEFGGVWYAPHMDGRNGLLKNEHNDIGYPETWARHDLVMAGSLKKDLDKATPGFRAIIENTDPNYERKRRIAIINAHDVYSSESLSHPQATCHIKMTAPTIASVRQAFLDHESRISLDKPKEKKFSHIESIRWSGCGLFQNGAVALSRNLNAVIGGRGAGKSSFLESIRYVLMSAPIGLEARKISDGIVRGNLADSQVTMRVWSQKLDGYYYVSRRFSEQTQIKTDDGEPSNLNISDILPRVDILGQNEIMDISNDEQKVRELLERFLPSGDLFAKRIRQVREQLKANRIQLLQLDEELDNLKDATKNEGSLKEQLQKLKASGIEDKLRNIPFIAEERRLCEKFSIVEENIVRWLADMDDISDSLPSLPAALDKYPNAGVLADIYNLLSDSAKSIAASRDAMRREAEKLSAELARRRASLEKNWNAMQDEVDRLAGQLSAQNDALDGGNIVSRYRRLQTQMDAVNRAKEIQAKKENALRQTRILRKKLLDDYRDIYFKRSNELQGAARKLNDDELAGKLRIGIGRMRLRGGLKKFIIANADGVGEGGMKWLDDVEDLDIVAMAEQIRANDGEGFRNLFGEFRPTAGVAAKIVKMSHAASYELEEVVVDDSVIISLNLAEPDRKPNFRPLDKLSAGQKCTAILELFLLNRDAPLILDQPEDHLDNAFIAERVAKKIRGIKRHCQLILSTHNANIPVFGDAELIVVLEPGEQGEAPVKNELLGSIDKPEVKERVANILDGGQEAFIIRKEKYGY